MIDREKVLKGLKCCNSTNYTCVDDCPYYFENGDEFSTECMHSLIEDAFELIQTYQQLIDVKLLMKKLSTLDRVAKSDKQKALLGRVFFIIENMIEENRGAINNDGLET